MKAGEFTCFHYFLKDFHMSKYVQGVIFSFDTEEKLAHFKSGDEVFVVGPFSNFAEGSSFKKLQVGSNIKAEITRAPTKLVSIEIT
jgi:hypothetical protein